MATTHNSQFTFLDYSNEKSGVNVYNGPVTVGTIAGFLTLFGNLRTALEGITLGVVQQEQWIGDRTLLSNVPPTDELARRETKWLVRYVGDTTDKAFTIEIPTADVVGNMLPMSDFADLTATDIAAFVTAFEAIGRSPDDDTETVTVVSIQAVGRNI